MRRIGDELIMSRPELLRSLGVAIESNRVLAVWLNAMYERVSEHNKERFYLRWIRAGRLLLEIERRAGAVLQSEFIRKLLEAPTRQEADGAIDLKPDPDGIGAKP